MASYEQIGVEVTDEDCWERRMAEKAFVRRLTDAPLGDAYTVHVFEPPPPRLPRWRLIVSDIIWFVRHLTHRKGGK